MSTDFRRVDGTMPDPLAGWFEGRGVLRGWALIGEVIDCTTRTSSGRT